MMSSDNAEQEIGDVADGQDPEATKTAETDDDHGTTSDPDMDEALDATSGTLSDVLPGLTGPAV